jgi:hypothetical protein
VLRFTSPLSPPRPAPPPTHEAGGGSPGCRRQEGDRPRPRPTRKRTPSGLGRVSGTSKCGLVCPREGGGL